MNDIRQFKPTLYILLVLGLTGFALAAEQPAMWLLSVGAVFINAWLVRSGKFSPMPRWLSNGITVLAFGFVVMQVVGASNAPILLIGQFLVLLHIIKLFEQRANRDYAQLLVLSLLLMVAAAISTASLWFGVLFIGYLFLSLYCCLLFHLKVEADRAKAAQPVPAERFNAATLRQDQRYLPRSMRRLTGLISSVALASAVVVFLFFPRGTGAGMLGQLQLRQPAPMTGFNDELQFNQVARITQNNTPVATVLLWHNNEPITTGTIRLRGVTFDRYRKANNGEWEWVRGAVQNNMNTAPADTEAQGGQAYEAPSLSTRNITPAPWRQAIHLDPIGAKALFALGGVKTFAPARNVHVKFFKDDETLQRQDNLNLALDYEVTSNGQPSIPAPGTPLPRQTDQISPELSAFAIEAGQTRSISRSAPGVPAAEDEAVAGRIETYLRTRFTYTLDLSDSEDLFDGKDPLAVFVTQTRRGHCEFFAWTMTVACQSLGMRARVVAGFVTDEYNSLGGFFQVRQSHAHTWVEVLTTDHGWVTFDPTSGREMPPNESRSTLQRIKHVFDWMEAKWAGSVIAYDGDRRDNVIQQLDASLMRGTYRSTEKLIDFRRWINEIFKKWHSPSWTDQEGVLSLWTKILTALIAAMALALALAVGWYIIDQRRIRRRAMKIGLGALPQAEQLRLARQLGFYERMTELLENHRIKPSSHQTPREFSRSLTYLPVEAYETIDRLTRVFYRVRYGGLNVPGGQQRRLDQAVQRLAAALNGGTPQR